MQNFLSPGGYGYNLLQGQGSDADIPGDADDHLRRGARASRPTDWRSRPRRSAIRRAPARSPRWSGASPRSTTRRPPATRRARRYIYEIEGTWESGELATFANQIAVPAGRRRSRARPTAPASACRTPTGIGATGPRPVEFVAGPNAATPTLAITELHYNPAGHPDVVDAQDLEFIEVLNTGTQTVNLEGVQLTTFASTPYVFAAGLSLAPGPANRRRRRIPRRSSRSTAPACTSRPAATARATSPTAARRSSSSPPTAP